MMMKGLVREGEYLTVFIPAYERALVFRVRSVVNAGREHIHYGPLPISEGDVLSTLDGGSVSVPADGVLPARAYTEALTFPIEGVFDSDDMWYIPADYRERIFHVIQSVTPSFLRIDAQIPPAVTQGRFQREKKIIGVEKDFGFARGEFEMIHFPEIHIGYRYANDTNVDLRTSVQFTYGEYVVEIPRDAETLFRILTKKIESHWITLPISVADPSIEDALQKTYGILGFELFRSDQRDEAIAEYERILGEVKLK